ncbi:MAG: PilZ domain-containing protein [Chitinispirillales bacterium]|nr:PilZ domain-containing protein [Chitinispirillales bacterium]
MTKKTLLFKIPFIALLSFFSTAYAQITLETFLQEYHWVDNEDWVVYSVSAAFVIVPIMLIVIYIFQRRNQDRQIMEFSNLQFNQKSKEIKLLTFEQTLLRSMTWEVAPKTLFDVFKSILIFESAVDAKIKKTIEKYGESGKTTEEIALVISNLRRKLGYDKIIPERQIQSTRNIDIGQIISITSVSDNTKISNAKTSEVNELYFSADLMELDDSTLTDDAPIKSFIVSFTRAQDAMYTAKLNVKMFDRDKNIISFYHSIALERSQARKYARLTMDIGMKCQCKIIERKDENAVPAAGEILPGTTISDISGGGLAFLSKISLSIDDIAMFSFNMQEQKTTIKGKIVAISTQEGSHDVYYRHRVVFCGVKQSDVERIIKYVYKKQQERLQIG